jgi:DNA-binding transcriptional LysR family regulator
MIRSDTFTLRLFIVVCEMRSISKAAAAMNTAISAASRRLQMLEDETHSQLLKRRPHGVETFPYSSDRLALAVPAGHPFAGRDQVALNDLFEEQFVALDNTTAVHRVLAEEAKATGRELKIRVQVRSFDSMCQMIAHGLGVGILPDHAARPLAEALALHVVPLAGPFAERNFVVAIRAGEVLAPPAARLLEHLISAPE